LQAHRVRNPKLEIRRSTVNIVRLTRGLLLALSISLTFVAPNDAHASISCRALFSKPFEKLNESQSVFEYDLPETFAKKIVRHPMATKIRQLLRAHPVQFIKMARYNPELEKGGRLSDRLEIGEAIQATFIKRVLGLIVSTVKVEPWNFTETFLDWEAQNPKDGLFMMVKDAAERGETISYEARMEMVIAKASNPGVKISSEERQQWRNIFGLTPKDKLVTLQTSFSAKGENVTELLQAAADAGATTIIVSKGGEVDDLLHEARLKLPSFNVQRLSQFKPSAGTSTKVNVLFNDSIGKMHIIHGIADATLISGAVNIFEPLIQDTPVTFFSSRSKYMADNDPIFLNARYNEEAFAEMARVAIATGGAKQVTLIAGAVASLKHQLNAPRASFLSHTEIPDFNGKTPIDRFLDNLRQHLRWRLSLPHAN
jgi:hypothetical protein